MRKAAWLAAVACVLLANCAAPFRYAPIGSVENPFYGYREHRNADGGYTLLVVVPAHERNPNRAAFQHWERRAEELCGHTNYRRNIFRAKRPTVHYDSYGGRPGDFYLEGYLYCDAAAAPAAQ